ncbi:MAG TPA: DUF2892 domain-containing protein [Bacteroidales bacterium]|nr:DUF2892 domain-containing protein [Bacteroidales bacterium]HRZ20895.1 DUF2892 domain-containing protein [Bacteroidales bacterium]
MKTNMGLADRIIRILIAAVLAILFFTKVVSGVWGIIFLIVAIIFLVTGFIGFCPLYTACKCNTLCDKNKKKQ